MATVQTLTEPYGAFLIHPLANGTGVCEVCHAATPAAYNRCYACNEAVNEFPDGVADAVVPISISIKREQFATELWRYKEIEDRDAKRILQLRLAAVLWRFLTGHEQCVAGAAGVEAFDVVTMVPSTGGRQRHPLREIAGEVVGATRGRFVDLLKANPDIPTDRRVHADRFTVLDGEESVEVAGASVLVIDDTWTRGGHAQSASVALKAAGARRVAIVVLGRHFDPDYAPNGTYLQQAREARFSWEHCCVHQEGLW